MAKLNILMRIKNINSFTHFTKRLFSSNIIKDDVVVVKRRGAIAVIGINRPEKKNALNFEVVQSIDNALTAIEKDDAYKVAILHGERGNLCFGYDLEELESDPTMIDRINEIGLTDRFSKIPMVAAVSGFAQGPGFELALWCDFMIVEETAVLGGFAKQLGVPISEAMAKKYISTLGYNKAMDWLLSGRTIKGKEALESGIATRLVAVGTGLGQAFSYASGLANMPEACLRANRAAIYLNSHKCTDANRQTVMDELETMTKAAKQVFSEKKYRTADGDVRKHSKNLQ